jgi:AcrR family transcriptional regulator
LNPRHRAAEAPDSVITPDSVIAPNAVIAEVLAAIEDAEGTMTEKKRRVIAAAIEAFSELGYAAATTSEIARRAGVAEATIFRHFESKKDMLLRIVRPLVATVLLPQLVANLDEIAHGQRDLAGVFRSFMRHRLDLAARYVLLWRILVQEVPLHPELRAIFREEIFVRLQTQVAHVLSRFVDSGQLRPVSVPRLARTGLSLVVGYFIARQLAPNADWNDEEEIDFMVGVLVHGLGGPVLAPTAVIPGAEDGA